MSKRETVLTIVVLIAIGVAARLLPHVPNFAPVTASALFCGVYMQRRYSIAAPLLIMLISDYLLLYIDPFGRTSFNRVYPPWELWHSALPYIYASYGISALAGWYVKSHRSATMVLAAALFCSVQFFLISNAGVWIGGAYDRGIQGLWQSYVAGLPFFRGTLTGDLVYTTAFFGLYELLKSGRRERSLSAASAVSSG